MAIFLRRIGLAALLCLIAAGPHAAAQTPPAVVAPPPQAAFSRHGMAASEERQASEIGVKILMAGGNAVDAGVAMGFALAVTLPEAGNLGGGGFMLIHLAKPGRTVAIDYRETAPAAAARDPFRDEEREPQSRPSIADGLEVGVPGTVAGLALAHRKYGSGRFTLAQLIAPAIRLAREGIEVDDALSASLARGQMRLVHWPSSAKIFFKADGVAPAKGDRLVQRDLAATLAKIAKEGPRAFYRGAIAGRIAASVRAAGGAMTRGDLARYRAIERTPVRGTYRGYDIVSMPPPSSGGVHLIQMLNVLEGFDLRALGSGSPAALHLMIETMKLAFADRSAFLGDPDFVRVPVGGLISKAYAAALRAGIDPERARPSSEIGPGEPLAFEGDNTTHYSVVDRDGNAVANTYTLNFNYGLGLVAGGTGILLNNELRDFAHRMAAGESGRRRANAPAPGKRPLSSMTPTIVFKDGKPFLLTGAAGARRIIPAVMQVIVNAVDHGMSAAEAVAALRVHHQWRPDQANAERGMPAATVRELEARGHEFVERRVGGSANSIMATGDGWAGVADPRSGGFAAGH